MTRLPEAKLALCAKTLPINFTEQKLCSFRISHQEFSNIKKKKYTYLHN